MNRKMLARLLGKSVQLFPTPRRRTEDGVELQRLLDRWHVEDVSATACGCTTSAPGT